MPFVLRPASMGVLDLVISVTRSAARKYSGGASRPVITTCWLSGRLRRTPDHFRGCPPTPTSAWVGEFVEHMGARAAVRRAAGRSPPSPRRPRRRGQPRRRAYGTRPAGAHLVPLDGRAGAVLLVPTGPGREKRSPRPLSCFALLTNWNTRDREAGVPGAQDHPERPSICPCRRRCAPRAAARCSGRVVSAVGDLAGGGPVACCAYLPLRRRLGRRDSGGRPAAARSRSTGALPASQSSRQANRMWGRSAVDHHCRGPLRPAGRAAAIRLRPNGSGNRRSPDRR